MISCVLSLFLPMYALSCWSCEGLGQAECDTQVGESRKKTVEAFVRNYSSYCLDKQTGATLRWGVSSAGHFVVRCDGRGNGCLSWLQDDLGRPRGETHPLGRRGRCSEESAELPANTPALGGSRRTSYLIETRPAAQAIRFLVPEGQ